MIRKAEMMEVLLEVCPAFRPTWDAFCDEWKESAENLPHYLALTDFARHVIGMLARHETENFPNIFAAIERLQVEGEHYVCEATIVGLLEDLQNLNLHTTTEPEQFRPFLGVESLSAWDELYEFWHKVGVFKDAGLLEPGSGPSPQIDPDSIQDHTLKRIMQQLFRKG